MKVLVLDNYDSFTYNIVQILRDIGNIIISVKRNDKIEISEVESYDKLILSPGPSLPKDAGIMNEIIKTYYSSKPILGICLGHQALAENFGANLFNMSEPYHGVQTDVILEEDYIFKGLNKEIRACRYHSWAVKNTPFPKNLKVIARDDLGVVMGISHEKYDLKGIQFHPESVQTIDGYKIIENFINN